MTHTPILNKPRALVIGEAIIDLIADRAGAMKPSVGGSPVNVAIAMTRLNVKTTLLTALGADDYGQLIEETLTENGIVMMPESYCVDRTSTAQVLLNPAGEAQYNFDFQWAMPHVETALNFEILHVGSASALTSSSHTQIVSTCAQALERGAIVSFDPNIRPALLGLSTDEARRRAEKLMENATVVKLSDEDAAWLYPDWGAQQVLERISGLGPSYLALTLGKHGALLATKDMHFSVHVPAVQGVRVLDTIGAGDSYMATFVTLVHRASASSRGDLSLSEMGEICSTAAAITVTTEGANPPWWHEIGISET